VKVRVKVGFSIKVRFRSEICKFCMHDIQIVQHILQTMQTDKWCATASVMLLVD